MLATLCHASKLFWGPLLWAIGPCTPLCMHPLWDLAMRCVMSSAVLCGRGDLPKLVLLGGIICAGLRCLYTLWESWSPLEWFWCYWGQSKRCHSLICCECVVPLVLNIPAKFQGDWSGWRWHVVVRIGGWDRGEVGVRALLRCWPISPLLCCIEIPALSCYWVHICMCCCTCSTSVHHMNAWPFNLEKFCINEPMWPEFPSWQMLLPVKTNILISLLIK